MCSHGTFPRPIPERSHPFASLWVRATNAESRVSIGKVRNFTLDCSHLRNVQCVRVQDHREHDKLPSRSKSKNVRRSAPSRNRGGDWPERFNMGHERSSIKSSVEAGSVLIQHQ
uniref:(northern house mosquito) hypothetical protein n=1 Tax=Culex pipiens TaxID=7175 RepID=A0A8D8BTC7_CULPI